MSPGSVIYTVLIGPLKLFFEIVYSCAYNVTGNPGLTIIFLSLAINFLVLPLYMRADAMQEEEKDIQNRLSRGVSHIRKTFKGDERMMILQTYYRQNDYKPTYVLRGAAPLFLEIPFFIAAYSFLSNLKLLEGVAFGPISDLAEPDGLLVIGSLTINLLPIVMTLVNFVSSAIFTRGYPIKTKIQLYGMAVFFLIFLYNSPSGLVFYWTLNNLFSLVKTIFYKLKHPGEVLSVLASAAGLLMIVLGYRYVGISVVRVMIFVVLGIGLQIPVTGMIIKRRRTGGERIREYHTEQKIFTLGTILLALLTGVMIPASVIRSSPLEFVSVNSFYDPVWYVVSAACLSFGLFTVWFTVFYKLADNRGRVGMEAAVCALSGVAVIDHMFFGRNLGTLSTALMYEDGMVFSKNEQLVKVAAVIEVAAVAIVLNGADHGHIGHDTSILLQARDEFARRIVVVFRRAEVGAERSHIDIVHTTGGHHPVPCFVVLQDVGLLADKRICLDRNSSTRECVSAFLPSAGLRVKSDVHHIVVVEFNVIVFDHDVIGVIGHHFTRFNLDEVDHGDIYRFSSRGIGLPFGSDDRRLIDAYVLGSEGERVGQIGRVAGGNKVGFCRQFIVLFNDIEVKVGRQRTIHFHRAGSKLHLGDKVPAVGEV